MLAIIISLCSFFPGANSASDASTYQLADSLKRPGNHADTTGRFVEVNRIFIIGNRITRDQIIIRELSLKSGDLVYNQDIPSIQDLDRKKLMNTRLFNKVEIKTLELDSNKVDVLVDLNERWYTFPAPLFELSDRNFNEWWQNYDHDFSRVNYGLRLYQFNMRGRNETLRFQGQLGFQRRFELLYRFPYIDRRQKHGLAVELAFLETKNLAFRTNDHKYEFLKDQDILRRDRVAAITYTYRKSFYKTHSVKMEYRNAFVQDTIKTLNDNYFRGEGRQRQEYGFVTYQFIADHRDLFAYPLRGYQFSFSATKFGLTAGDDVNKFETSAVYSRYFDLKKKFYLSNSVLFYWSNPDDLSYVNYGALGLKRQFVRGYEVYVIEGPWYFLNKTTFKKLIFSREYHWDDMPLEQFRHIPISIYLKTYVDLGYVNNYPYYESMDMNTRLSNKLLTGTGVGIDIVGSYDVVLRLEYSFNREGEQGFFFHVKREF